MNRIDCKNRKPFMMKLQNNENVIAERTKPQEKQIATERDLQKKEDNQIAGDRATKGTTIVDKTNQEQIMKILHPQIKVNYVKCSNLPEEYSQNSIFEEMKKKQTNDKHARAYAKDE